MFHFGQLHWCGDLGYNLATLERDPQESSCGPEHKSETGATQQKRTNQIVRSTVSRRGPSATHFPVSSCSLPPLPPSGQYFHHANALMPLDFNDAEFCAPLRPPSLPKPWAPIATCVVCPSTRGTFTAWNGRCRCRLPHKYVFRSNSGKAVTVLNALRLYIYESVRELTVAREIHERVNHAPTSSLVM